MEKYLTILLIICLLFIGFTTKSILLSVLFCFTAGYLIGRVINGRS